MYFYVIISLEMRVIMQKYKKIIPNILTIIRLIITPLAIYLGINGQYKLLAVICIIVALTDFFDGKLARRWDVCTEFGAKLDTISDKTLAIGLLIILILKNKVFLYMLVLELLIAVTNLLIYIKTRVVESLLIGKFKTWVLYITLVLGIINIFFKKINILMNIGIVLSLGIQILTLFFYIRNYLNGKKKI